MTNKKYNVIDKFTQDDINQTIEFMIDLGYPIEEALKQTNAFKKKYGISEEVK